MAGKLEIVITAKDEATKVIGGVHDALAKIGGAAVTAGLAAAAAGIAAIGAAAVTSVTTFLNWGETLDGIGDVLGSNADQSAALAVAIKGVGGDVETLTAQMGFMARGLLDAEGGLGPVGEALTGLGIGFQDIQGNILPATDIISNVADVIGTMPDGLEKTSLMMDIFGKSGKDLSDTLAALANGGLDKAAKKAKEFGLAIGDKGADSAVQFGRTIEDLKLRFQGFMVSLGGAILPALENLAAMLQKALADPAVQAGIQMIVDGVANLATAFITWLPVMIGYLVQIANWFAENPGVIFGVLAALGVAIAVFVYSTVIPAAIAMIAAFAPIILVFGLIAGAFYLLYQAWTNNWGGIRDTLTAVWEGTIKPALQALYDWLQVNIPIAIATLKDWWENVLHPALITVWTWISTVLIPIFKDIWDWLKTKIPQAIDWITAKWGDFISGAQVVVDFLKDKLTKGFEGLRSAVQGVIDKVKGLLEKLGLLKDTDLGQFNTNSPTPFEVGLRGISAAMNELSTKQLPGFTAKLNLLPVGGMSIGGIGGGGGGVMSAYSMADQSTNYYQLTIHSNAPVEPIVTDFEMMRAWS